MDKAAKRLAIIYVVLLSLCAPLMAVHFELYTWFIGVVDMSYWAQMALWFLPMLVYGGILQFLFLTDVLDAMYLAAGKWGRGKKSSVLVALVYVAAVIGIVWIVYKIRS